MQIRRCTSLFLAILLLISNLGLAFNVHYCGNKIASFSSVFSTIQTQENSNSSKETCCCITNEKDKNSCCKDKVVDFKKDTKEVVIKTFSFQVDASVVLINFSELVFSKTEKISSNPNVTDYYCNPNAPPLFKLYQQYIFYA